MPKASGAGVAALVTRGARLLRKYDPASRDSADVLRALAEVLVEIRKQLTDAHGRTDWAGRSYAYREALREMYTRAGISATDRTRIQGTVRYHVGHVVREVAPPEDLKELGLVAPQPSERNRNTRVRRSALVKLGTAQISTGNPRADVVRMAMAADIMLTRVEATGFADLDADTAAVVAGSLEDVVKRATSLLAELRRRG